MPVFGVSGCVGHIYAKVLAGDAADKSTLAVAVVAVKPVAVRGRVRCIRMEIFPAISLHKDGCGSESAGHVVQLSIR
jgi:hypothetical protein